MLTRRAEILLLFLLLFPTEAWAHHHRKALSPAGSLDLGSTQVGGALTLDWMFSEPCTEDDVNCRTEADETCLKDAAGRCVKRKTKPWNAFAEIGTNAGVHDGNDRTQTTFMGGLRWNFAFGGGMATTPTGKTEPRDLHQPFFHVLGALVYTKDKGMSDEWKGGFGGGGGWRYCPHPQWTCLRLQFDYLHLPKGQIAKNYRLLSLAIEYRWGTND